MRFHGVSLVLFLLIAGCSTISQVRETGFLNRHLDVGATNFPYVVYVPAAYQSTRSWPVILFLHGAGERGNDGWKQVDVGLGRAIRLNPERFAGTIVVFPQAPPATRWTDESARAALAALDRTIAEFNGDPSRLYLTGISLGGYGTWHLAVENPARFAAIVPVCGGVVKPPTATSVATLPVAENTSDPYAAVAAALPDVPTWIFHGSEDPVIPVTESQRMVEELKRLGRAVRYTEFPGVGHNSWDPAYAEAELWRWMLAQRR